MAIAMIILISVIGILAGTTLQGINPNNIGELMEFSPKYKKIGKRLTIFSISTIIISFLALIG